MREINWDAPLSEDDKAWLRQRDRYAEIEANEDRFSPGRTEFKANDDDAAKGATQKDDVPPDDYDKWKVPELAEEAARRDPPVDLTGISKKPDIIAALRTWDAAHPELLEA